MIKLWSDYWKNDHIFNIMWNKVGLLFLFWTSVNSHKNPVSGFQQTHSYKWPNFRLCFRFCVAGKQLSWTTSPTYHYVGVIPEDKSLFPIHSDLCPYPFTLDGCHPRGMGVFLATTVESVEISTMKFLDLFVTTANICQASQHKDLFCSDSRYSDWNALKKEKRDGGRTQMRLV